MGADAFYVYYGVRRTIPLGDEDQVEQLEADRHPVCELAYQHRLQFAFGRLTDGADYFLLIGRELGCFGVEGSHEQAIPDGQLAEVVATTKDRLRAAGIKEAPAIHLQLEAQH
jgi:hypothetical protein